MLQFRDLLAIGCFFSAFLASHLLAEDMGTISSNQTLSGEIAEVGEEDTWSFAVSVDETVMIGFVETSGLLSPCATLRGPDGSEVISANRGMLRHTASQAGTYSITIADGPIEGDTTDRSDTGVYNITLVNLQGGSWNTISSKQTRSGAIDAPSDIGVWQFSGSAGDHIKLALLRSSGSISPFVILHDPDGRGVSSGTMGVRKVLDQTGTYSVTIYDGQADSYDKVLEDTGSYDMTFANLTADSWPTLSDSQTCSDTINARTDMDFYKFSASETDRIMISAMPTSGDLYPRIRVYAPDGKVEFDEDLFINDRIPETGTYTIEIFDGDTGLDDSKYDSTGGYNMTFLNLWKCPATEIPCNETWSGSINVPSDIEVWRFHAIKGQQLSLRVLETSGSLYPELILYLPDGGTYRGYRAIDWTAERTGRNLAVVYDGAVDNDDASLDDTGDYEITVHCADDLDLKPDLVVSELVVSKDPVPQKEGEATVSWTVKNSGDAAAPEGHWMCVRLSADAIYDETDAIVGQMQISQELVTGASVSGHCNLDPDDFSLGDYFLLAKADDHNDVLEASETNNTTGTSVSIAMTSLSCVLMISSTTGGSTDPSEGTHEYDPGSTVTVAAIPASGYMFTAWSGGLSGSANPATIVMDSDKSVTAHFQLAQTGHTLATGVLPAGAGSVTRSPNKTSYSAGESVTLTATPATGYEFTDWSGSITSEQNPTTIAMNYDMTVTANFAMRQAEYTLTISSSEGGSTNPAEGTYQYSAGSSVPIGAIPDAGYWFAAWTGTAVNAGKVNNPSTPNTTVRMDGDYSVRADFTVDPNLVPVEFIDPNLKTVVEETLGILDPTRGDMLALISLEASESGISDLSGLEHATNCTSLDLHYNRIMDLSPIAALTQLQHLHIHGNRVTNLEALTNLSELQTVWAWANLIKDLSALTNHRNLDELNVRKNPLLPENMPVIALIEGHNPQIDLAYDPIAPYPDYAGGSGTAEDPFQIADKETLIAMSKATYDYDKHFALISDIDLIGTVIETALIAGHTGNSPLWYEGVMFGGSFDGQGHIIRNLLVEVDDGDSTDDYLGLFGFADTGSLIQNVSLENVVISCAGDSPHAVGTLAGLAQGSVEGCASSGDIVCSAGARAVGGLIGDASSSSIHGCHSYARVSIAAFGQDIGGLVGYGKSMSLERCHSEGEVVCGNDGSSPNSRRVGGLVGTAEACHISLSYAVCTVDVSDASEIGGFVGTSLDSGIRDCYALGDVTAGLVTHCEKVGGFCGTHSGQAGSTDHCYTGVSMMIGPSASSLGGFAGFRNDGGIFDCFWDVDMSGLIHSAGGGGLTTTQMQSVETYLDAGWDFVGENANGFENVWIMSEEVGYPILTWQVQTNSHEDGLVAHWTFDELSGTVVIDSVGGHDGTVHGALPTDGVLNGARYFDGVDDYVDMGTSDTLSPEQLTVAFWMRPEAIKKSGLVCKAENAGLGRDHSVLLNAYRQVEFFFGDGASNFARVRSTTRPTVDAWTHVAVTRDGAEARLYLDGVFDNSAAYSFVPTNQGDVLRIGALGDQSSYFYKGRIDDVRIYDIALTEEAIDGLAGTGF